MKSLDKSDRAIGQWVLQDLLRGVESAVNWHRVDGAKTSIPGSLSSDVTVIQLGMLPSCKAFISVTVISRLIQVAHQPSYMCVTTMSGKKSLLHLVPSGNLTLCYGIDMYRWPIDK